MKTAWHIFKLHKLFPKKWQQRMYIFRLMVHFLALFFLLLIPTKVYLHSGFPYTHDGENHLARFANYKLAIKEGQLPPRLAPNLYNHYGYPVFNYNYPLANILSLPFSFAGISYELTFKILAIIGIGFALLTLNAYLQRLKFGPLARFFALATFALSPYLVSLTTFRGNIGELLALCLLPTLLLIIELFRIDPKNKLYFFCNALALTAFFLAHNVTVLFAMPLLTIYSGFRLKKTWSDWRLYLGSTLLAIGLTLWFWLPAILEKHWIILDGANLSAGFADHFSTWSELFFPSISFGFSLPGSVDSLSIGLGIVQSVVLLLLTVAFLRRKRISERGRFFDFVYLGVVLLLLFQTTSTAAIWQILPLVSYIQFPWRLFVFTTLLLPILAAQLFSLVSWRIKIFLLLLIFLQALAFFRIRAVDYFHRDPIDYEFFSQSTSTANENLPKTFTYLQIADWQPQPQLIAGEGTITDVFWRGSQRSYTVTAASAVTVVEPSMYFPGWETFDQLNQQKIAYLDNQEVAGRIAYQLAPGIHTITSKFTQHTWPRLLGNYISLASGLFLAVYLLLFLRSTRKRYVS